LLGAALEVLDNAHSHTQPGAAIVSETVRRGRRPWLLG
jgi:hypothetical protein